MAPDFVLLHVHGGSKKVRVRRGDNVLILKPMRERVAKFPSPRITRLHKKGARLVIDVQYQTEDKKTRVESFLANELESVLPLFRIGDKVVVKQAHPSVVVSVGTRGTVVGGDGNTYHVSFVMNTLPSGEELATPIRVSQDCVEAAALEQVAASESEYSSSEHSSDHSESEEERSEPPRQTGSPAKPEGTLETLSRYMSDRVARAAAHHLSSSLLAEFAEWLATLKEQPRMESTEDLQGYVVKFTRSRKVEPFPAEHIAALRAAGASSVDIAKMQRNLQLQGRSARELIEYYTRLCSGGHGSHVPL